MIPTIVQFNTSKEISREAVQGADILRISKEHPDTFYIPEKIGWVSAREGITSIEDHFRKRSDFIRWKEAIQQTYKVGIRYEKSNITPEIFARFYDFYVNKILEKERGKVLLRQDWISYHESRKDEIGGIFAYDEDVMVGGLLFFFEPQTDELHASILAVSHMAGGITCGIQQLLLEEMIARGLKRLSYGKDRNLYGVFASSGLLYSKTKFGLTPKLVPNAPINSTLILNKPDTHDWMFFSPTNESDTPKFDLHIISDQFSDSIKKYESAQVNAIYVHTTEDIILKHKQVLEKLIQQAIA